MNRLEIIHLRSAGTSIEDLATQIRAAIGSDDDEADVVTVYRRSGLATDVAVHITSRGRPGTVSPSVLGLRLASALSAHGLVDHALWEELT